MVEHNIQLDKTVSYPLGQYIDSSIESIDSIIDFFAKKAKNDILSNDKIGIVCRGSSGCIMAAFLYRKLRKIKSKQSNSEVKIFHIKKKGEVAHSNTPSLFFAEDNPLYIWIDDFIDSGETYNACLLKMRKYLGNDFEFDWSVCVSCGENIEGTKNLLTSNKKVYEG